jgi:hypothetical protein
VKSKERLIVVSVTSRKLEVNQELQLSINLNILIAVQWVCSCEVLMAASMCP